MKILKLSPYCAPEQVSSSHLTEDLTEAFFAEGFYLENHVPTPTRGVSAEVRNQYKKIKYEEMEDGHLIIHRFSMFGEGRNPLLRALRYVLVNILQYFKGSKAEDVDVIYAASTPPTQGVLCGLVKRKLSRRYGRNVPFVYNLQDIFPDSLVTAGMTRKGSLIWKLGRKIEDFTYRSADQIITISQSMKQNILDKGVPEEKILVVSNWIDLDDVQPVAKRDNPLFEEFGLSRKKFTVLYAGNFGAAQGTGVILEAARKLQDQKDIQFVIFGGGPEYEVSLQAAQKLPNVTMNRLLPVERVPQVYSLGDAALITCKKGVGTAGLPSKTWSIMACNTPIIASFDVDSDLSGVIRDSGAGVCVPPEDADALVDAIMQHFADWQKGTAAELNLRSYVQEHASRDACVRKYVDAVKQAVCAVEKVHA